MLYITDANVHVLVNRFYFLLALSWPLKTIHMNFIIVYPDKGGKKLLQQSLWWTV